MSWLYVALTPYVIDLGQNRFIYIFTFPSDMIYNGNG